MINFPLGINFSGTFTSSLSQPELVAERHRQAAASRLTRSPLPG